METTEKIVESYCRNIKHWFTIPNIKCKGQHEIDLLAIDARSSVDRRYHVECGVSISGSYSPLTDKQFSPERLKERLHQAGQRRTLGYFNEHKFENPGVLARLAEYGFLSENGKRNYERIIVTWSATAEALAAAKGKGIVVWDFRECMREIAQCYKSEKTYFTDDTLRTIQL